MAQSNATIYIKPNTLTSLNVVAITDEGTLNLSLSDFVQSSIPSGVYLAYTASDFNRIKSVTVSSPGYKTATWSTTDTHLTDVYITLEEVPNPVIREISVGGVVYDIATKGGSGSSCNIGDIFYTTRTDTALAGAVECNGGTYSTADYEGAGSIGELLAAGKLPYISLAEYSTYLTTHNGICGVFGWDGGTTTAFRVPLLKDVFIEATRASDNQLGWYMSPGLPNISATFDVCNTNGGTSASGDITLAGYHNGGYGGGNGRTKSEATATLKPKNSIYGNSSTVQPEAVKYRAMVQLFNSATDQAVATVGTVVAQVGELNSHRVVDFQIPTAENGYTWYRKYADGWVEQGGLTDTTANITVSLPVEMAGTNYSIVATSYKADAGSSNASNNGLTVGQRTTTTFYIVLQEQRAYFWQVSGKAA